MRWLAIILLTSAAGAAAAPAPVGLPLATRRWSAAGPAPADPAEEIAADVELTCARSHGGSVRCWGGETSRLPVAVPRWTDAISIAVSDALVCAVHRTGSTDCIERTHGPLRTPRALTGVTDAIEVAASGPVACVRRRGGGVACWAAEGPPVLAPVKAIGNARMLFVRGLVGPEYQFPYIALACTLDDHAQATCFTVFRQAKMIEPDPAEVANGHIAPRGRARQLRIGAAHRITELDGGARLVSEPDDTQGEVCRIGHGPARCFVLDHETLAPSDPPVPPEVGDAVATSNRCTLSQAGVVDCKRWGEDIHDRFTFPGATQIASDSFHACVLAAGRIACWGHGELLGNQPTVERGRTPVVGLDDAADIMPFTTGALVLRKNGQLAYWGWGQGSQLAATDVPITFSTVTDAIALAPGPCVMRRGGHVACLAQGAYAANSAFVDSTEIATALRASTDGSALAKLASGRFARIAHDGTATRVTPVAGTEHAIDVVAGDAWVCARERVGDPVRCWADLPTGAPPAVELALPGELALVDARSSDSPPYGTLLVRAPTGAVTAVTLRVEAGRATARRARFGTPARAVFTANQEVCARTDKELRCANIVGAETTQPIAPDAVASANGTARCDVLRDGHVLCSADDAVADTVLGIGVGLSDTPVPVHGF